MQVQEGIINLGILAHVDAGKTSITELFLHKSGLIRNPGNVDKGTTQTDGLEIERKRGISIRAATASFQYKGTTINLIDTPGHSDFSAEIERSLLALDSAILVISAAEGIQAQTISIWNALKKMMKPCLIFINKIDRAGVDIQRLILDIKKELSPDIALFQEVEYLSPDKFAIESYQIGDNDELSEKIIGGDEQLFEQYFEGLNITQQQLKVSLENQIRSHKIIPLFFGSAKFDQGIDELLNAITQYLPNAKQETNAEVSAYVFKVEHDAVLGRLAHIRLFEGVINQREVVFNQNIGLEEKVSQIYRIQGLKKEQISQIKAGDIAAVNGLNNVRAGDFLGKSPRSEESYSINTALLSIKVEPQQTKDYSILVEALQQLSAEDPYLDLQWHKTEQELYIRVMGMIQIEIIKSILLDKFKIESNFSEPTVIYKETPIGKGIAFEEYTMPKPCWAVVKFEIEQAEQGSGVHYSSKVGVNDIAHRYQQEIERSIPLALQQGIKGWEVTDININLIGGEHHQMHSRAGDFKIATPMAIMKALKQMGTRLLEPILEYHISAPEEYLGKVVSDLSLMRADIGSPTINSGLFEFKGHIPLSTSLDYPIRLSSLTSGKAKWMTKFTGYQACPPEVKASTPFRGVSPLDRAKYILKARKALQ